MCGVAGVLGTPPPGAVGVPSGADMQVQPVQVQPVQVQLRRILEDGLLVASSISRRITMLRKDSSSHQSSALQMFGSNSTSTPTSSSGNPMLLG